MVQSYKKEQSSQSLDLVCGRASGCQWRPVGPDIPEYAFPRGCSPHPSAAGLSGMRPSGTRWIFPVVLLCRHGRGGGLVARLRWQRRDACYSRCGWGGGGSW
jgi:hypothetical protein